MSSPGWLVFCLLLLIALEGYFLTYPPRGLVSTDVLYLGNVAGNPTVDFPRLWARFFNDDAFMLDVIRESGIRGQADEKDLLAFLSQKLRRNLTYAQEQDCLVKISLRLPTADGIRPFLNCFSKRLLGHLQAVGQDNLSIRLSSAQARLTQLQRRLFLLDNLFGLAPGDTLPLLSQVLPPFGSGADAASGSILPGRPLPAVMPKHPGTLRETFSQIGRNEIDLQEFNATVDYWFLAGNSPALFQVFPRESRMLSSPQVEPEPVQPFIQAFYLLLVIAVGAIYVAGLFSGAMADEPRTSTR